MARASDVSEALATLQARWGAAAPRRGGDLGARDRGCSRAGADGPPAAPPRAGRAGARPEPDPLAPTPLAPVVTRRPGTPAPDADGRIVPTGFAALDAILGPGRATTGRHGRAARGARRRARRRSRCGPPRRPRPAARSSRGWTSPARSTRWRPSPAAMRPEWLVVLTPGGPRGGARHGRRAARGADRGPAGAGPARRAGPGGRRQAGGGPAGPARGAGPAGRDAARGHGARDPGPRPRRGGRGGERPAPRAAAVGLDPPGAGRGGPAEHRRGGPQPVRPAGPPRRRSRSSTRRAVRGTPACARPELLAGLAAPAAPPAGAASRRRPSTAAVLTT